MAPAPERWRKIEALYHSALERDLETRAAFLAGACGRDDDLRREVESLLAEAATSRGILDRPAAELLAEARTIDLKPGTRLGSYQIEALIGQGGMGKVYRARDTRLGRTVAIKTSSARFSERFEREARAVAALNHPHICHLYDVGPDYLVMEYIEGTPLVSSTKPGPLPTDQALKYAEQILDALDAAHRKGITHRDLKPGNILVSKPAGSQASIKLLDFGLAQMDPGPDDPTWMPSGPLMGTPAYMAPEQWQGKRADARSDIYSFGCVLYEMLTGKRAATDRVTVEPPLEDVVRTCLEKDPEERWQSARELKHALRWAGAAKPATARSRSRFGMAGWVAAGAFALVAAVVSFVHFRDASPEANVANLSVKLPPDYAPGFLALSPDGRRLVLTGVGGSGLYLRSLDSPELRPLPGTEGARVPFWSPDSRLVGFFADGKLKTIPITGGPATVLCDQAGLGLGGTWNHAGVILFSSGVLAAGPYGEGLLRRVNASGGSCTAVIPGGQGTSDDTTGSIPEFLPDGDHFLYASSGAVYVASLDGMKRRKVLDDNSNALYAPPTSGHGPGHLLFLRDTSLMAQPFDTGKLETVGDPFALASPLAQSLTRPQMAATVAGNGTLAWIAHVNRLRQFKWFDRAGNDLGNIAQPGDFTDITLSPGGDSALVAGTGKVTGGIWLFDFVRKSQTRLTGGERGAASAVWAPGGDRFVYASHHTLVLRDLNAVNGRDASGEDRDAPLLPHDANGRAPSDWSRDGRFLIYSQDDPKTRADIWYLPDPGKAGSKPVKFLGSDAIESQGQLSPDGHWLAYYTDEPGNSGVSIRSFPSGAGVWRVAANATEPRWSRDGKELFYKVSPGGLVNTLMAVAIQFSAGGEIRLGDPRKLFSFVSQRSFPHINAFGYAPSLDGKRFLVTVNAEGEKPEINVILAWQKLIPAQTK